MTPTFFEAIENLTRIARGLGDAFRRLPRTKRQRRKARYTFMLKRRAFERQIPGWARKVKP